MNDEEEEQTHPQQEQGTYVPDCEEKFKPRKGAKFATLEEGISFYKQYARHAGFDIRISSAKKANETIIWRYVVCRREGDKFVRKEDYNAEDDMNKRRRVSIRCGCMARVIFKYEALAGYIVNQFVEEHNHALTEDNQKRYLKMNRKIDPVHQKFVMDCAKSNIGPTQAYKLINELMGGTEGIGCSLSDVRNFARDMKAYVEGSDAQMLLNEMTIMKELCDAFTFEYEVDKEDKLKRIFWCDPTSRRNFYLFGDVVSFDTTYSTNKYCMIFAPFTGKDNHGRPVSFGAALLSKEDADTFTWLFQKFIQCMGASPKMIITDQDLGMKAAVERVLPGTRHRWCMWHIMLKVADKVPKALQADEEFKKELNSYVWSEIIEPEVFEEGWSHIMEKYQMTEQTWFNTMFDARQFWVPAYFRDTPMSGLMRTTSISECENSFFKTYTRPRANLMEFWRSFTHAIEAQRQANAQLNYIDNAAIPSLDTTMSIEKHAAKLYTTTIFRRFQEELSGALFLCRIKKMQAYGEIEEFTIEDEFDMVFCVKYSEVNKICDCDCKLVTRMGTLCRHILFVFKNKRIKEIPETYISGRWKKQNNIDVVHGKIPAEVERYASGQEGQLIKNKIVADVFGWIQKLEGNNNKMALFLEKINDSGSAIIGECHQETEKGKNHIFDEFYGTTLPEKIDVLPPEVLKTKGSGSRLVSRREKADRMKNKPLRRYAKCKQMANHDSRNCDKVGGSTT